MRTSASSHMMIIFSSLLLSCNLWNPRLCSSLHLVLVEVGLQILSMGVKVYWLISCHGSDLMTIFQKYFFFTLFSGLNRRWILGACVVVSTAKAVVGSQCNVNLFFIAMDGKL